MLAETKILVVDDDEFIRYTLTQALAREHVGVAQAASAREALALCEKERPDLVLFHLNLPGTSPFAFAQALREIAPNACLVATTGLYTKASATIARELGCADILSQPVDVETLDLRLARVLSERAEPAPRTPPTRPRILVVDDDEIVAYTVAESLATLGCVRKCLTAMEAIEALRTDDHDLLLVDLKMEVMDGLALIAEARRLQPEIAPVIMTGYPELESAIAAFKAGAHDYLIKPLEPNLLRVVVGRVWERRQLLRQRDLLLRELQASHHELSGAHRYAESIIANFLDTLVVVGLDGRIQTVNPATCKLLGYREEELVGKPVRVLFEEEEEEVLFTGQRARLLSEGCVRNYEMRYRARDGRTIPMSFNAAVMRDAKGEPIGFVAGAKDISEVRRLIENLKERNTALTQMQTKLLEAERLAAFGQMAAGLAHDFGNPLAVAHSAAQVLHEGLRSNADERHEYTGVILAHTGRMHDILGSLRQLSLRPLVEPEVADLGEIARQAADLVAPECQRRGIELAVRVQSMVGRWDVPALRQAVLNLLTNAMDAIGKAPDGRITLTGRLDEPARAAEIAVANNGPAIPDSLLPRLFEPFFTTKTGGLGLGLYLGRRIARGAGGDLRVRNAGQDGVAFVMSLPIEPQSVALGADARREAP